MAKLLVNEISRIDKLRKWLREERRARGWSANRLEQEAKAAAKRRGETTDIKQQSISSVENGQTKNVPAWVPYVAFAFEDHPAHDINLFLQCDRSNEMRLPDEQSLKKIFLGFLAPLEISLPYEQKNYLASALAKKLPFWIKNGSNLF